MPKRKQEQLSLNASGTKPDALLQVAVNGKPRQSEQDPYVVLFDGGQVIANETEQKDGTRYDIETLDIDNYSGKIFKDHWYGVFDTLGSAIGLIKDNVAKQVTLGGIRFSKNNPDALLARDMLLEGLVEFSQGTIGFTESDGLRKNHRLIDISLVGLGNNDYTVTDANGLRAVAANNGFDLSKYNLREANSMKYKIYNVNGFAVKVKVNDADGKETEVEVPAGGSAEVATPEAQAEGQKQVDEAKDPAGDTPPAPAGDDTPPAPADNSGLADAVNKLTTELSELKKNMNTPVKPNAGGVADTNGLGSPSGKTMHEKVKNMKAGERLYTQIMLERNGQKNSEEYQAINDFNKEELIAKNALTDDEASVGGLIPPYELLDRIEQCETNYDAFLNVFGFQDAGLSYGWNLGIGDIEFLPVGYCDPSAESDFETALQNRTQERLATHTVICDKVSRFSPANVVGIVAGRYQGAYKKALAAFALAEMQEAVDQRVTGLNRASGTDIAADPNGSLEYPATGQKDQAAKILQLFTDLSDCVLGGTYVMNAQTAAKLILDFNLGATGILSNGGTLAVNAYDRLAVALGGKIVIVPNSMLPTLGTNGTVTVVRTANAGGNVTIDHAIFYLEPSNWYGVTNGGLQFDIDSFGSYEKAVQKTVTGGGGGTVTVVETHSAKQRGETVMFGEMYRGGGVLDFRNVGGVKAAYASES